MTETKRQRGQRSSYSYTSHAESYGEVPHETTRHDLGSHSQHVSHEAPQHLQRIVTVPDANPSLAWNAFAKRQEQMRRTRSRPQRYVTSAQPMVRTYAQTGVKAPRGRTKAVQHLPQQKNLAATAAIPTRSGSRGTGTRRGFLWRALSLFAMMVVLLLAAKFAFSSNAFRIEQVNVQGTHNSALVGAIQRMGMQGQNIFLVNVDALTARVDTNPLVASVSLSKQWPNQLTVTVAERVPVLLWQTAQGTYSVDKQGMVIAPVGETPQASSLLTVVDANKSKGQTIRPGTQLNPADIQFALNIFDSLSKTTGVTGFKLLYNGGATAATESGSYVVESAAGWLAYLGSANNPNPLENRLIELQQILALAQQQQLTLATVDVRYGLRPVYTLKN